MISLTVTLASMVSADFAKSVSSWVQVFSHVHGFHLSCRSARGVLCLRRAVLLSRTSLQACCPALVVGDQTDTQANASQLLQC